MCYLQPIRHSTTRWLKSELAALLASAKLLAITNTKSFGNETAVAFNGFHSIYWAQPDNL